MSLNDLYRRLCRHFPQRGKQEWLTFLLVKSTSPRRRTPPFRQTLSATFAYAADAPLLSLCDIFPVSSRIFARFAGEHTPDGKASGILFFYNKKRLHFYLFRKICSLFLAFFNAPIFILQHYFGVVFVRLHIRLCLIKIRNNRLIRRLIVAKRIKYLIFFREKSPLLYEFHFVFVRPSLRRIVEYF